MRSTASRTLAIAIPGLRAGVAGGGYGDGVVADPSAEPSAGPLAGFSEPTRAWFGSAFAAPTPPQTEGWPPIAAGDHTLVCAPTGTGKTLAAFLWAIDRLMAQGDAAPAEGTRVLYVSPLRALAVDVEKNLRAPLHGIRLAAERLGTTVHAPTVGVRTGGHLGR